MNGVGLARGRQRLVAPRDNESPASQALQRRLDLTPTIEDFGTVEPAPVIGGPTRRMTIALAIAAAIVSYGFVFHEVDPGADRVGRVANPVASLLAIASPVVPMLPATHAQRGPATAPAHSGRVRTVALTELTPVVLSDVSLHVDAGSAAVVVGGFANSDLGEVRVGVMYRGRMVAKSIVHVVVDERPGRSGLGSFVVTLPISGSPEGGRWQVIIEWHDPATGLSGSTSSSVLWR